MAISQPKTSIKRQVNIKFLIPKHNNLPIMKGFDGYTIQIIHVSSENHWRNWVQSPVSPLFQNCLLLFLLTKFFVLLTIGIKSVTRQTNFHFRQAPELLLMGEVHFIVDFPASRSLGYIAQWSYLSSIHWSWKYNKLDVEHQ